jgi:hypothetical protein
VIIPGSAEPILRQAATGLGIEPRDLSISPLSHEPDYSSVEIRGEYDRGSVRLITSVFQQGGITVLVGTKSLLGESWDAPCINMVLASFVGSFVLSNQMRERSIRVDSAQPQKTANIWHLVCVESGLFGPGDDYELLVRRCSAFAVRCDRTGHTQKRPRGNSLSAFTRGQRSSGGTAASVRLGELDKGLSAALATALAQIQVIGLSGCASIRDTGWG